MTEASADPTPLAALSAAFARIVAGTATGIVSVRSRGARSSGFVWRPGLIVTADDALADEGEVTIAHAGGDPLPARIAGRDPTTDIALLRIDGADLPPVPLATPLIATGALAIAVGAEDGAPVAALGVVSRSAGPWQSLRGGAIDVRIELNLRLQIAAEGGLALDAAGQAIGMTVFGPRRRVLVIPSATIERVAARLESHGRIARGYLGLSLQPVAIQGGGSGAMVMGVDPQGPGAKAGIHQGDILSAWNGAPIRHVQSLMRALGPDSVNQTVTLDLHRAGATRQVSLTIGERPAP